MAGQMNFLKKNYLALVRIKEVEVIFVGRSENLVE